MSIRVSNARISNIHPIQGIVQRLKQSDKTALHHINSQTEVLGMTKNWTVFCIVFNTQSKIYFPDIGMGLNILEAILEHSEETCLTSIINFSLEQRKRKRQSYFSCNKQKIKNEVSRKVT